MTKSTKNGRTIEYMRGTGPGGQNRNKIESACRITDLATGITAYADARTREVSFRMATEELETRIKKAKKDAAAAKKKARRDVAIHDHTVIRTYNYSRGTVLDHRSGKQATIKNVVEKGKIDLLK